MDDLSKDTLLFAKELRRMCEAHPGCKDCPSANIRCTCIKNITPELIKVVQKWRDEHSPKTYAQDFRAKFPKCAWNDDGNRPRAACVNAVYRGVYDCIREDGICSLCWNEPMKEEDDNEID